MAKTLEFLFDFGSPNCWLAYRALPPVLERTGARLQIEPALLGGIFKATNNQSPVAAFANVKGKIAYENLEMRRFIARHGLTRFSMNPNFPVNTLGIMRGAVAARVLDVFASYVEAVFVAMWEDGRKMDDPGVIAEVLGAAGLPADRLMALTRDQSVKNQLMGNTQAAVTRGVFGSPSFFVGDDLYFGKDRLSEVEAALRP
jgi:2-hydroxychromene-2-carboxylate isomerase